MSLSLLEWLQYWIDTYAPLRCTSEVTIERYQRLANYVLRGTTPELAALRFVPLSELSHSAMETAFLSLLRAPAERRAHLSRKTVRHVAGLIHAVLEKARKLGHVRQNIMDAVELPSPEPSEVRSLTIEEIARLRKKCRNDWTGAFIELALATGCRRGELLALEWSDLDPRSRVLTISKALEESKKYGIRLKLPKTGKVRRCTLPHSARLDNRERRTGLIFPDPSGRWMKPALVSQAIVRRMRSAGIENASLHSLRHTHATTLLSRGMPITAISSRLGHADATITLRIYCHALPLDDGRLADAWDAVIAEMR